MAKLRSASIRKTGLVKAAVALAAVSSSITAYADDFPKWDAAITKYNERQVRNFHPKFDFDSDGCYAATPFHRNDALRQNPGTKATSSLHGGCKGGDWLNYANTVHRQICKETVEGENTVERCAHLYELYFEKDQAIGFSFLGGHRHDVETVIVWTGKVNGQNDFASHVSTSAHGDFTTRPISQVLLQGSHPMVVYHKHGIRTHAFRFANADDKQRVEFMGNWGEFHAPDIISHYSAVRAWNSDETAHYQANKEYRLALETSNFGSGTFKTRSDGEIANTANKNVPRSDPFWQNTSFSIDDAWWTRDRELKANYPATHAHFRE